MNTLPRQRRLFGRIRNITALRKVSTVFLSVLTLFSVAVALIALRPAAASRPGVEDGLYQQARLSESVSLHASEIGNSNISLSDGRRVITDYRGPRELIEAMVQDTARPLSLASGDFDRDGVMDLIGGYAMPGGGVIAYHRGNHDSIYPNSLEAQLRRSEGKSNDAPFVSPGYVFSIPGPADFIRAGDFDADGNLDVLAASRGGEHLYLLSGDGRGQFKEAEEINLPGRVSALEAGDINRRDGLDDVVVCVVTAHGAQALVFEGPEGALRADPEVFALPAEASGLAVGQLNKDGKGDIVVAAGRDLVVIEGRDRKLSLSIEEQSKANPARPQIHSFSFDIKAVQLGDFTGRRQTDVALLAGDGSIIILSKGENKGRSLPLSRWKQERLSGSGKEMVKAGVSSLPADDLLVLGERGVQIIIHSRREREEEINGNKVLLVEEGQREQVLLAAEAEPVAALAMRLNGDAIDDLVMLMAGRSAAIVAPSVNGAIITVNTNLDTNERDNVLTLREAIL
ncbi:MAG TPA: VCBS repeat-containing protein, partial [Blastocatellia bacterium]|nr:VCBS repeat-containing protein [Blastocatellia bacterium]